jgi:ribosomal protein S18 acetylase RimI-like enzyme
VKENPDTNDKKGNVMIIRKARQGDVDAICELWCEFMDFHEKHDPIYKKAKNGSKVFHKFITEQVKSRNALVLVAIQDKAICAYLLAKIDQRPPVFEKRRIGVIYDLAVSAPYRRQGMGESLYKESIQWFRKKKINRVELTVATSNPLSTRFWKKHGFKPCYERRFRNLKS